MEKRIFIFDTTLRDGNQSPGVNFSLKDKLFCAKLLEDLGVDILEVAFPASSDMEYRSAVELSKEIKGKTVCCLARTNQNDIELAARALGKAKKPRIHTFISTSKVHMDNQLRKSEYEILEYIYKYVHLAKQYVDDVQWSAMDSTRSEKTFLKKCISTAIDAGATTINLADTVGFITPEEYNHFIQFFVEHFPKVIFSVHCHNDLGLATSNALAGVLGGARQIECTINGIGERAGNSSLEEVVMCLKSRKNHYKSYTCIDTKDLYHVSKNIECITGYHTQKNKAIVGGSAYLHQSGIHQDGLLKKKETYEIINPEEVGARKSDIVLGMNSGTAAISSVLRKYNINYHEKLLTKICLNFKKQYELKRGSIGGELALIETVRKIDNKLVSHIKSYYLHSLSYTKVDNMRYSIESSIICGKEQYTLDIVVAEDKLYYQIYESVLEILGVRDGKIIQIKQYYVSYNHKDFYETLLESSNFGKIYFATSNSSDRIESFLNSCLDVCSQIMGQIP